MGDLLKKIDDSLDNPLVECLVKASAIVGCVVSFIAAIILMLASIKNPWWLLGYAVVAPVAIISLGFAFLCSDY